MVGGAIVNRPAQIPAERPGLGERPARPEERPNSGEWSQNRNDQWQQRVDSRNEASNQRAANRQQAHNDFQQNRDERWNNLESAREDLQRDQNREDWQQHREDLREYRSDRAEEIWDNATGLLVRMPEPAISDEPQKLPEAPPSPPPLKAVKG